MKTLKQRQFKKLHGIWVVNFDHTISKLKTDGTIVPLTMEELNLWFHFIPTHWFRKVIEVFVIWGKRLEARHEEFKVFSYKVIADAKSKANNYRTYYVKEDWNGNLIVMTWTGIKNLKRKGLVSKQAHQHDFRNESIYVTKSKMQIDKEKKEAAEEKLRLKERKQAFKKMSGEEVLRYLEIEDSVNKIANDTEKMIAQQEAEEHMEKIKKRMK